MDTLKEFIVIAIVVLLAAVFLKVVLDSIKSTVARAKTPVSSVAADVAEKRSETGLGEFKEDGLRLGKGVYNVDFKLENGETLTLQVAKSEYDGLTEGAHGILNYREKTYLGFTPDALI